MIPLSYLPVDGDGPELGDDAPVPVGHVWVDLPAVDAIHQVQRKGEGQPRRHEHHLGGPQQAKAVLARSRGTVEKALGSPQGQWAAETWCGQLTLG